MDPRHAKRTKIVQNLYALCFIKGKSNLPFPKEKTTIDIQKNLTKIDGFIAKHAPKYPLERIAKTDLSILRLAVYELFIVKLAPYKVVINEAVELAREIGSDRSYAFINAVLGSILNEVEKKP
ncbi:hypothetical protein A2966_03740 [Candidatus Roizmanbacteria bacterium RIFCSPLOWO2_01_FULL_41_22]|uniref:NusB/RsmB/TIM44 domain-containing protein n=2 Tax=Candidatus Roizmaniibacteriota TaxID=1752723 RepID=A0A1F7JQ48_9BACT|nr:MAG: hypothetical protein A2966_03740 [Candidatus Roizmanbacteria bacterium RIFCSPLOWO2_01_FULL_41_22]OGK57724.1 MAG: hypothetical protein A3H86_03345 [Candidatus Roizmanbacteria bacterium RIFCSPLOWO2_02_FULL_41_9]